MKAYFDEDEVLRISAENVIERIALRAWSQGIAENTLIQNGQTYIPTGSIVIELPFKD